MSKRIITGLKPTGELTLGNYIGAILPFIEMQKDFDDVFLFVADLHALTVYQDPKVLRDRIKRFVDAGLKGLECIYSLYNDSEQKFLLDIAEANNLIISGGSDYHGLNKKVSIGELSSDNNSNYEYINLMDYIKRQI